MIKCTPEVKILADSCWENDPKKRITTFQLRYWRPIHSEVLRHRVFSHSVRSSRACPIEKYIQQVMEEPWGPSYWGTNQKGMVPGAELQGDEVFKAKFTWEQAAKAAALLAVAYKKLDLHKQIVNRILEPYSYVDDVLTGDDFENFFKLRCASDAQAEIRTLAEAMKKALQESTPQPLSYGDWHLPYIEDELKNSSLSIQDLCRISAARCARVSYKLFDGTTSIEKDLELAERLMRNHHYSPFEHQACFLACMSKKGNIKLFHQQRNYIEE